MTFPLTRWDDELRRSFSALRRKSDQFRSGRPLFALEHGLDPDSELPELEAIGLMLEELVVAHKVDPANILVATGRRSLRDRIRREAQRGFACVPWEGRHDGDIGCETVYRVKGLERDAVILATALDNLSDHLLRVGMSRVIARPVVIGPKALSERSAGSGASVCRN